MFAGMATGYAISPPFNTVWNTSYEAIPADTESESLGASRIRDLKVQLRSRLSQDMSWIGNGNDGYHNKVTLLAQPSVPLPQFDQGATGGELYSTLIGGNSELFYGDNNNHQVQLTTNGSLSPTSFHQPTTTILTTLSVSPYTPPTGVVHLWVRLVGGGSGGGGGNNTTLSNAGQATTFGALQANGGAGSSSTVDGSGGSVVAGCDFAIGGGAGNGGTITPSGSINAVGGAGAPSPFGGAGGTIVGGSGGNALANSGSGGGGGGTSGAATGTIAGAGGAAGGYCEKTYGGGNLQASYTFAVGQGGTGATGGTNGLAGGSGGAGSIWIIEYYF